jgi:hypothetical protein
MSETRPEDAPKPTRKTEHHEDSRLEEEEKLLDGRHDEEQKLLDGRHDVNYPALLTRDVKGG